MPIFFAIAEIEEKIFGWGGIKLSFLTRDLVTSVTVLVYLSIGFIVTNYFLRVIYESSGIGFLGNVWVNWFGVSFLIYFMYTMICGLLIKNENTTFKERMKSPSFWFLFVVSLYIVFIPFITGENPF